MTTTKRPAGEVRFLATKALVGGLSVAAFIGAWVLIAATAGGAEATSETALQSTEIASPVPEAGPQVIIERQVIYVVGAGAGAPLTSAPAPAPRAAAAPQQSAAPPAPKASAAKSTAKKSRGS